MQVNTPHPGSVPEHLMPPCNLESEVQVVGSLLLDPSKLDEIGSMLKPSDFHHDYNRRIYTHLVGISENDGRVDVPLLVDRMRRADDWVDGMAAHIADVVQSVAVALHVKYHANIVLRASRQRQLIHIGQDLVSASWQHDADPEGCLSVAEEAMAQIRTGSYNTDPQPISEVMVDVMRDIDDIIHKRKTAGCMTGLLEFDEQIGGLFRGELTIVAARPGQGKTSLALQMAAHCAASGRTVYFATLEMPKIDLAMKRLCSVSGVSSQRVRTGQIDIEQRQQLVDGSQAAAQTEAPCVYTAADGSVVITDNDDDPNCETREPSAPTTFRAPGRLRVGVEIAEVIALAHDASVRHRVDQSPCLG